MFDLIKLKKWIQMKGLKVKLSRPDKKEHDNITRVIPHLIHKQTIYI